MQIGTINTKEQVLIVAEIGNNHGGKIDRARRMIDLAAQSGANAVKFQTFLTEHYVSRSANEKRFENLKNWQLSFSDFENLAAHAREIGILFFSTPFDLYSAEFLGNHTDVHALKISSGDNTFYPLIRKVAQSGKPIIISTGIANSEEIKKGLDIVFAEWKAKGVKQGLSLLHCVCSYPVDPTSANLRAIKSLASQFPFCVPGYSDHTDNNRACITGVALGARIVERHFTDDRNSSEGPDHKISADPGMMVELVKMIRDCEATLSSEIEFLPDQCTMLGDGIIGTLLCEEPFVSAVRRSTIAARNIGKGSRLKEDMLSWVRPSGGIPPEKVEHLLNRRILRDLSMGEMIFEEDLSKR